MRLSIADGRKGYFEDWGPRRILLQFVDKEPKDPTTISDIRDLAKLEKLVVGTPSGDLEELLTGEAQINPLHLATQIAMLPEDKLLLVPEHYRINAEGVRQVISYNVESLVRLDSARVREKLGLPRGSSSIPAKVRREYVLTPQKLIGAAFDILHEHKEEFANEDFSCYSWLGKDRRRRVVSLYRAVQGAELRAYQNFAAYHLLIPLWRKQMRTGVKGKDQQPLSDEERADKKEKVERYERWVHHNKMGTIINSLEAEWTDLIEPHARTFDWATSRSMRVPSRLSPPATYITDIHRLPRAQDDTAFAASVVWDMEGCCPCEDARFRDDRRAEKPYAGNSEVYFCAHQIATAHVLRKMYENKEQSVPFLPFVLPTKFMMDFVDRLRYQAIMITTDPQHNDIPRER